MSDHSTPHQDRDLTRDEVFVPPLHRLPEQWERDNALFTYRLIKRSGWIGKLAAVLLILAFVAALVTETNASSMTIVVALGVGGCVALVLAAVSHALRKKGPG